MRAGFFILLFANLAFLGWAHWVDSGRQAPTADATARLPRLKLVNEVAPALAPGGTAGVAGAGDKPATTMATPASMPGTSVTPATLQPQMPAEMTRCVSIGPFGDLAVAAKAAGDLRARGFTSLQRAEQGETWDGFWVYIGAVADADSADKVFKILDRNGIKDAHLMPGADEGRRISVGLFSDRDRAERRVKVLEKMGLKAEVAQRKQPGTQYWVDLALRPSDGSIPVQDLLAAGAGAGRLSVQSCPKAPAGKPVSIPHAAASDPDQPDVHVPSTTVAGTPKLH